MTARAWELLLNLLTRPVLPESLVVRQSACRRLIDEEQGARLLRALAEHSPARAREVLAWSTNTLDHWDLQGRERVIEEVEEETEARILATLSDEELQARATLHVLLPPDAGGMHGRTRVLARALEERFPTLAATVLLHLEEQLVEDIEPLRRNIMLRLQDSAPQLALILLDRQDDALAWLKRLLAETSCNRTRVDEILTGLIAHRCWPGISPEALLALARQVVAHQLPSQGLLLHSLALRLRHGTPARREARSREFFQLCVVLPTDERRGLGDYLRKEIAAHLPREERCLFLRRLSHWLRPALEGPDDTLQRALQADRATALLSHLPIRRLATAHLWQESLARKYRRRL
jgi:hypothetical protein